MPRHVLDVMVPRHCPETGPSRLPAVGVPEDRSVLTQPGELVMRRPAALIGVGVNEADLRRRHGATIGRLQDNQEASGWPITSGGAGLAQPRGRENTLTRF